ncbi:hypothetical protein EVAR_24015_1 [Eumeta japonica]|uniref:Uncharacterized protein n=1 Tax=Eumeta variegata TaxID=151549 RepID=A0A4C1WCA9_EUMVA|nr:hypothetical protein EVAR_24015_1 [Eumeta japonica]
MSIIVCKVKRASVYSQSSRICSCSLATLDNHSSLSLAQCWLRAARDWTLGRCNQTVVLLFHSRPPSSRARHYRRGVVTFDLAPIALNSNDANVSGRCENSQQNWPSATALSTFQKAPHLVANA